MSEVRRIDSDRVKLSLQAILDSQTFARSERLRAFLRFVVEMEQLGRAHQLKGYTIGIDVFSRDESFDPGADPLVRVQAGKLRRLLNQYYADEGRHEPLRIRIPLGCYVPIYEWASTENRRFVAEKPAASWPEMISLPLMPDTGNGLADVNAKGAFHLPHITISLPENPDWRTRMFTNAVRIGVRHLWGIKLDCNVAVEAEDSNPLDFSLDVNADSDTSPLTAKLRHRQTGKLVVGHSRNKAETESSRQVAAFANQFCVETLSLTGQLYHFCQAHSLSSVLMDCLEATYLYNLDNSPDSFIEAARHQRRLVHPYPLTHFISDLSGLMALTADTDQTFRQG
ncbi:hypothetical protein G6N76_04240 [Rhizobium daejeonense]|uniref:Uncharacterized protein n=1 Tax=Rhizobium daejeonense TaxID=240521 RepID=A0A6M1RNL4_9HYPH|nr:hypothetical protein [Rhizobium daejeonense]NGO62872.1 hypothetical protein [Rhizobium daejeonense]